MTFPIFPRPFSLTLVGVAVHVRQFRRRCRTVKFRLHELVRCIGAVRRRSSPGHGEQRDAHCTEHGRSEFNGVNLVPYAIILCIGRCWSGKIRRLDLRIFVGGAGLRLGWPLSVLL
jgi:hypothetical protein